MVFKKLLSTATKRKSQDSSGRPNTNKINFDPVSAAILSRHFSPLPFRIKSPTELLDIIGYPQTSPHQHLRHSSSFSPISQNITGQDTSDTTPFLRHKSNETQSSSTPNTTFGTLRITNGADPFVEQLEENHNRDFGQQNELILSETSRKDKTLVERSSNHYSMDPVTEINRELSKLYQKLLEIEHEREQWNKKLDQHMEEMRNLLREHQLEVCELKRINSTMADTKNDGLSITISSSHDSWNDANSSQTSSISSVGLPPSTTSTGHPPFVQRASSLSLAERCWRSDRNAHDTAKMAIDVPSSSSKKKKKKKRVIESWPVVRARAEGSYYYYAYIYDDYDDDHFYDNTRILRYSDLYEKDTYPHSNTMYTYLTM